MKRSVRYLQKTLRQPNISKTTADLLSTTENHNNPSEKIEDLGYLQRSLCYPKSMSSFDNKVGFAGKPGFGSEISGSKINIDNDFITKRKAYIIQRRHNHMQSTPIYTDDGWNVEFESEYNSRTNALLGNRTGNDAYDRWGNRGELKFINAESAVKFCVTAGVDYEVIYQGNRYHTLKSYAENFNYKKEEVSDAEEDDIDFSRI